MPGKRIYLASDLHLGVPDEARSREREIRFVKWLDTIKADAEALYLLGDVFDFWFEYKRAVPKGFVRIQGKLAELADAGIPIHYFVGNHDMWMKDYFTKEMGMTIHYGPLRVNLNGREFFLAHGDGLGPGDSGYKFLKRIFRNPFLQWAFGKVHPNLGIGIAEYFSRSSRKNNAWKDQKDYGDNEFLLVFSREYAAKHPEVTHFVFGHRHFPVMREFGPGRFYINLGDWISHDTFLVSSDEGVSLLHFNTDSNPVFQPVTAGSKS